MKKNKITTALLAMAGLALVTTYAKAQGTTTQYNDGDVLLSIRQVDVGTGANSSASDYLADLGSATDFEAGGAFYNPGHAVNLNTTNNTEYGTNLGNISADIGTGGIFGSNWYTSGNTVYAVVGAVSSSGINNSDAAQTLYVTSNGTSFATRSVGSQTATESQIEDVGGGAYEGSTTSGNSQEGVVQGTGNGTYGTFQAGGGHGNSTNYNAFGKTILSPSAGQSDEGLVNTSLTLWLLAPNGTPEDLGTFNISSGGTVTFTAVPEPSTYAMLGIAAAFFVIWRMKRNAIVNPYQLIS